MNEVRITHIITRIKDGETTAFVELVESYKDMVYTLCLRMTNSLEDAEEVAQDTFVKAYQNILKFKGKSKFSTWLYKIAYRTAVNYHRKKRVKTTNFDAIESPKSLDTSFDELQHNERSKYIEAALKELEPIERGIITFFYLEGYSIEEIATITALTKSNVKVKIHRSKKKLFLILQDTLKNELNSLL